MGLCRDIDLEYKELRIREQSLKLLFDKKLKGEVEK